MVLVNLNEKRGCVIFLPYSSETSINASTRIESVEVDWYVFWIAATVILMATTPANDTGIKLIAVWEISGFNKEQKMSEKKALAIALIGMVFIFTGCGESLEQEEAKSRALDNNTTTVASCSTDGVFRVRILMLSTTDMSAVCEEMARIMGRNPSVRTLRMLSNTVSAMKIKGDTNGFAVNAYQFMRIVESRGQLNDDSAMMNTFDVVFKIFSGTAGRVTPKDLNILLRTSGPIAKTLSDDGLINIAAMLSSRKIDMGQ
jgi:hypothetical protein